MVDIRDDCLGCRLANGLEPTQVVYEDEYVSCILDIAPMNEGHILILPKNHYSDLDELDEDAAAVIMKSSITMSKAIKTLYKPDGVTIIQNNGAFNDLGHYHMHVFPRYESDGFGWIEPETNEKSKNTLSMTKIQLQKTLKNL